MMYFLLHMGKCTVQGSTAQSILSELVKFWAKMQKLSFF